jgi:hypothetical protein
MMRRVIGWATMTRGGGAFGASFGAQPVSPAIRISSAPPAALRRRCAGAHPLRPISIMRVAVRSIPLANGALAKGARIARP